MGRTIPSFRIVALAMEKEEWKPFRNALDKRDKKEFDEMFDIPRWYISACSNSVHYVRLPPTLMSILLSLQRTEGMHVRSRADTKKGRREDN
jgi:hypothetical protein